ncbi:glycerophosphodiester phosphodiesterase [Shewanella ulleungensis]|uniref:glycerophosphodiester phosphodiesterase n=1 Tax=Shewanella ulleungensis TaxID=2282699 RepID=UPI003D7B5BA8
MTSLTFALKLCNLIIVVLLFSLTGCKSLPAPSPAKPVHVVPLELAHLPADATTQGLNIIDTQLSLGDRNLYLANNGNIKMLSTTECRLEISAHRGDFRQPESSANAIKSALQDNYNSVEIDVMLLKDGTWVNHHDSQTGRATVYYTGERFKLNRMTFQEFANLKLRDKQSNNLLDQRPIAAVEAFKTFAAYRNNNQQLNVEIKSDTNGQKLVELDSMLRKYIGLGGFYYSAADQETLYKLRGINPSVYLGFIQGGHPTSIEKLTADLRKGVKNDAYYLDNQHKLELVGKYGTKRYRSRYKDYTATSSLSTLQKKLGRNSGIHLDIRSYMQHPSVKYHAHQLGMKVYTYSLNGSEYHQSQLIKLTADQLPDGAIVDATPYTICQRLYHAAAPAKHYTPVSHLGRYIMSLPQDADFDRFNEMRGYQNEGYYLSLDSGLAAINSTPIKVVPNNIPTPLLEHGFPTITDENIDNDTGETIILRLPQRQAK